jgi:hypothetical protein
MLFGTAEYRRCVIILDTFRARAADSLTVIEPRRQMPMLRVATQMSCPAEGCSVRS